MSQKTVGLLIVDKNIPVNHQKLYQIEQYATAEYVEMLFIDFSILDGTEHYPISLHNNAKISSVVFILRDENSHYLYTMTVNVPAIYVLINAININTLSRIDWWINKHLQANNGNNSVVLSVYHFPKELITMRKASLQEQGNLLFLERNIAAVYMPNIDIAEDVNREVVDKIEQWAMERHVFPIFISDIDKIY